MVWWMVATGVCSEPPGPLKARADGGMVIERYGLAANRVDLRLATHRAAERARRFGPNMFAPASGAEASRDLADGRRRP
jgi:hypothetical protein